MGPPPLGVALWPWPCSEHGQPPVSEVTPSHVRAPQATTNQLTHPTTNKENHQ